MKSIINGTRYDTDKAEKLGTTDNIGDGAQSTSDFHWWQASLYKTPRSGRYFIHGRGGPRSMFAISTGPGQWSGDERIIPFETEAEAFKWAQEYFSWSPEWIEQHFGHLIADD
jgi:hypothetical protein